MGKICRKCHNVADPARFDGANEWFCEDCVEEMIDQFHDIFGCWLSSTTAFSGVIMDLVDLEEVLRVIKRNEDMFRWEISDRDLHEASS